jgi:hypothetical protein
MTGPAEHAREPVPTERPPRAICQRCGGTGVCAGWRLRVTGPDRDGVAHGVEAMAPDSCKDCVGEGWLTFGG